MQTFTPDVVAQFENETWSRCAESYMDGFGALVTEAVDPLLNRTQVKAGDQVLDIGTGPGIVAGAVARRGAQVVGIDFSEKMLFVARRLHPQITFQKASAESLPFEDKYFDVVLGNFVLHHSGNPKQVLSEAYRVLRDNGRMGFTVWGDPASLQAFGVYFSAIEEHAGSAELPHGPLFGISDLAVFHRMAQEAGFRESSVEELDISWRTRSLAPYLASFHDWANLSAFPQELHQPIEASVRERAKAYRQNGIYDMPNPAILISASK